MPTTHRDRSQRLEARSWASLFGEASAFERVVGLVTGGGFQKQLEALQGRTPEAPAGAIRGLILAVLLLPLLAGCGDQAIVEGVNVADGHLVGDSVIADPAAR